MNPCPLGKIRNPATNRCVLVNGKIGKKLSPTKLLDTKPKGKSPGTKSPKRVKVLHKTEIHEHRDYQPKSAQGIRDKKQNQDISELRSIISNILIHKRTEQEGEKTRDHLVKLIREKSGNITELNATISDIRSIIEETIKFYDDSVFSGKLREYAKHSKLGWGEQWGVKPGEDALMWFEVRLPIWTGDVTFSNVQILKQSYNRAFTRYRNFLLKRELSFIHFCVSVTEHEIAHGLVMVHDISEIRPHPPIFWEIYSSFSGTNVFKQLARESLDPKDFDYNKGNFTLKEFSKERLKLHFSSRQYSLTKESLENIIIEAELLANQSFK